MQHFGFLKVISLQLTSANLGLYDTKDENDSGWRFIEYFKALTELAKSDTERNMVRNVPTTGNTRICLACDLTLFIFIPRLVLPMLDRVH